MAQKRDFRACRTEGRLVPGRRRRGPLIYSDRDSAPHPPRRGVFYVHPDGRQVRDEAQRPDPQSGYPARVSRCVGRPRARAHSPPLRGIKRQLSEVITAVAARMVNTPTVCGECYIHPEAIAAYTAGQLLTLNGTAPVKVLGALLPSRTRAAARQ
jgi:hypothetical protein